jgi:hypothetical protein
MASGAVTSPADRRAEPAALAETAGAPAAKYTSSAPHAIRTGHPSMVVTMRRGHAGCRDAGPTKRKGFCDEGAEGVNGGTNA